MPRDSSTPSSSVSSWLTTRSVTPVLSLPRLEATASNSSKNSKHGDAAAALWNTSRTDRSEAPMYLLSSSGPLTAMSRRSEWLASAPARNVLPHPCGPYSSTPDLARSGHALNSSGYLLGHKKVSSRSDLTWNSPPTSSQRPSGFSNLTVLMADGTHSSSAPTASSGPTVSTCSHVPAARTAARCSTRVTSWCRSAATYPWLRATSSSTTASAIPGRPCWRKVLQRMSRRHPSSGGASSNTWARMDGELSLGGRWLDCRQLARQAMRHPELLCTRSDSTAAMCNADSLCVDGSADGPVGSNSRSSESNSSNAGPPLAR